MEKLKLYSPSGNFSPISFLLFGLASIVAFPLLGLIYAYAIWYIPFIYINFILAGCFGIGISIVINQFVVKFGKVRKPGLARIFSFVGVLIALYFHWAVWADLVMNAGESYGSDRIGVTVSNISFLQVFGLATSPSELFNLIGMINEYGTWGIRGATVSGTFLSIIWVIETLIITIAGLLGASSQARKPFCELEDKWYDENELPAFDYFLEFNSTVKALAEGNEEVLSTLSLASNLEGNYTLITLYSSKNSDNYITVVNKVAKLDKDGKVEHNDEVEIEYLFVDKKFKDQLLAITTNSTGATSQA